MFLRVVRLVRSQATGESPVEKGAADRRQSLAEDCQSCRIDRCLGLVRQRNIRPERVYLSKNYIKKLISV